MRYITNRRFLSALLLNLAITFIFDSSDIYSQCISGSNTATVFTNDATVGTIAWNTPTNAQASDNSRSSAVTLVNAFSTVYTNYLVSTGYGFSIPVGAIICGIEVSVEHRQQGVIIGSSVKDNALRLVKNGVILGADHASAASWPSSDAIVTYGGPTDLWGTTWTASDINNANFGAASVSASLNAGIATLALTAEIDQISVKVYYDISLPVELINFDATRQVNNNVLVTWATASELNNDFFSIERSTDAIIWNTVAEVDGAGNSTSIIYYSQSDSNPLQTAAYYRLKQTDFNGQYKYSSIVSVDGSVSNNINVYPNPASDFVFVETINAAATIVITNTLGQIVYNSNTSHESSMINISNIPNGVYFINVQSLGNLFSKMFIKHH